MEIRNVEDCFRFRLLRKIEPDKRKSEKSLEIAQKKLINAQKAIKLKIYEYAILEAYTAMFHSARALLYRDGVQEKSHYAVSVYLKELYADKIPMRIINLLSIHRTQRHEVMYGLEFKPEKDDATTAAEDAKDFVEEIKKVV